MFKEKDRQNGEKIMRLWQEIFAQMSDGDSSEKITGFFYTVREGRGGYFQNVKGIGGFSPNEITLTLRRGVLKVTGENLSVEKYCESDVFVKGKIISVAREDE